MLSLVVSFSSLSLVRCQELRFWGTLLAVTQEERDRYISAQLGKRPASDVREDQEKGSVGHHDDSDVRKDSLGV